MTAHYPQLPVKVDLYSLYDSADTRFPQMTLLDSDKELLLRIEADLADIRRNLAARKPSGLYEPTCYVLESVGKRLRPVLVHLSAQEYGATRSDASPLASAVEVFHNFTLVHDDVMDNASQRRGRATVHERWDVSTAILVGDLLLGLSYELVAGASADKVSWLLSVFGEMVVRLCEGQTVDMQFENQASVTIEDYLDMIDRKTGALLSCCLRFGGIIGGADERQVETLGSAGLELGRAFQIQDDLLDLVATDPKWGKTTGGDLIEGKKAYLLLKALESDNREVADWFSLIAKDGLAVADVDRARTALDQAGVLEGAAAAVQEHSNTAGDLLAVLPDSVAKDELLVYVGRLAARRY